MPPCRCVRGFCGKSPNPDRKGVPAMRSIILALALLTGLACTTEEVSRDTHPSPSIPQRSSNVLDIGSKGAFLQITDPSLPEMGAVLKVNPNGELWLGIQLCQSDFGEGRVDFMGAMWRCDPLMTDFDGQFLEYKLTDYPVYIDNR